MSEGEGSLENGKKKEKTNQTWAQQAQKRKNGIPHSHLQAREGVPVHLLREREWSAEMRRKKDTDAKELLLGGQRKAVGAG